MNQTLELWRLSPGQSMQVGNKILHRCMWCEKLVRLDKPIFGSLHICLTDDEKAAKWVRIQGQQQRQP